MPPGGGGGKGGPLLRNGPLASIGNNGPLIAARGEGTKPGPVAASLSAGRDESGTFKFYNKLTYDGQENTIKICNNLPKHLRFRRKHLGRKQSMTVFIVS